ncbi:LysE/ArgO family amino acid transporter [Jannaschia aquimarina]|uniref:ArgO protein n=1 Tax=Jannaschia aquimarina TaxID=935700 RepID=A0A0D1CMP9_9RHOB|nr:LysE/ArgO family amino acid transporter [Jannaschia aquimarina]KIT16072.1 Arginine exporter protein ArgO [Jannaschia aquimarina]SNT01665.1 L-lysine exporter family protein LysE/ArgO [Jannaschia aquimarina]
MTSLLSGFGLGLSLILAIGAQNAFVLRQGLRGEHVLPVVLTCALSEIVLISIGVLGFGTLVARAPWAVEAMRWGGVAFLLVYAAIAARRAWIGGAALRPGGQMTSLRAALLTCLAVTWLNPHAWLDTVVLLGSVSTQAEVPGLFGAGAIVAAAVFFFSLGFGARLLRPIFARPAAWRALDAGIALVMTVIAVGLATG